MIDLRLIPEKVQNMDTTKNKFSKWLNLNSYKLKNKLLLLILSLFILTLLLIILPCFLILHHSIVNNNYDRLNELSNLKSKEIESKISGYETELLNIGNSENFINALAEFKKSFKLIKDEKSELFYTDSLKRIETQLGNYYKDNLSINSPITGKYLINYLPEKDLTLVYQYLYISKNPYSLERKHEYITSPDHSTYSSAHSLYHPFLMDILRKMGASDLYLIDPISGDVIYSSAKNIDFASNLYDGKFRKSPLSEAFRVAIATTKPLAHYVDFENYIPALDRPCAFISMPVFLNSEISGVIILQFNSKLFDRVLFDSYMLSNDASIDY